MFKLCIIVVILLIPVSAFSERIYGQVTPTYDGGAYIDLRSSNGNSATVTTYRDGNFDIYTTPSTAQSIGDLNRAQAETRQSIENLDRQLNGNHD
jgi:hypothetical protein